MMSKPSKPVTQGPLLPIEKHLRDHIARIKETDPEKGSSISVSVTQSLPKFEDDVVLAADYRRKQSEKARKPRGTISESGETISDVIRDLATRTDSLGDYLPAKTLWFEFIGELDRRGLDPVERLHPTDLKKLTIEYLTLTGRKQITYGRFEAALSHSRGKKKLR